jgi:undecaprenyl pyrophosphate phosphatase UppP
LLSSDEENTETRFIPISSFGHLVLRGVSEEIGKKNKGLEDLNIFLSLRIVDMSGEDGD